MSPKRVSNTGHLDDISGRCPSTLLKDVSLDEDQIVPVSSSNYMHQLTMRFKIPRLVESQTGLRIHVPDQCLKGFCAGLCENRRAAVLVLARGSHHGAYYVAALQSPVQGLEHQGNDSFAAGVLIGPLVEAVRMTVRGEKVHVAEDD